MRVLAGTGMAGALQGVVLAVAGLVGLRCTFIETRLGGVLIRALVGTGMAAALQVQVALAVVAGLAGLAGLELVGKLHRYTRTRFGGAKMPTTRLLLWMGMQTEVQI